MDFYKPVKILIPLDFSKTSMEALDHATHLAKLNDAEITLMHVIESIPIVAEPGYFVPVPVLEEIENGFKKQSDKHLEDIADRLKNQGQKKIITRTALGRTHKEIVYVADQIRADIIVMGTHGVSGVHEFFAGSNTFRVIKDAKCPVLSVRTQNKFPGFRNILVPFRDKPHSREKIDYALSLAKIYQATIQILGVDTEFSTTHAEKLLSEAEQIQDILTRSGVDCKIKIISDPYIAETILKYAKDIYADLIISMSDLDKMNIVEYFTGPYSQQIVNHSPIPVLSIRPTFNTDTIDLRFY